jgi:hypothetical protein
MQIIRREGFERILGASQNFHRLIREAYDFLLNNIDALPSSTIFPFSNLNR